MNRLVRYAVQAAEAEGLDVLSITCNRHYHVAVRSRLTGCSGVLTVHMGVRITKRFEPSIRSQARSIARFRKRA